MGDERSMRWRVRFRVAGRSEWRDWTGETGYPRCYVSWEEAVADLVEEGRAARPFYGREIAQVMVWREL